MGVVIILLALGVWGGAALGCEATIRARKGDLDWIRNCLRSHIAPKLFLLIPARLILFSGGHLF